MTFDLGLAAGTQNSLRLTAATNGGQGGAGGTSGAAGSSGTTSTDTLTVTSPSPFTTIYSQQGGTGADGGDGRDGTSGATARSAFSTLTVTGDALNILINGAAHGGAGGSGGNGGRGGSGAFSGAGGDGGSGGAGGQGLASVDALNVTSSTGMQVQITLSATGGSGAGGGSGNVGGVGTIGITTSSSPPSTSSTQVSHTYAGSGAGGDGGNGGLAAASFRDSVLNGSSAVDAVYVTLAATGGLRGLGAAGGAGAASSTVTSGNTVTTTTGTATGTQGANGNAGTSRVEMSNVIIALGGGDDSINLSLLANGTGVKTVLFSNNSFAGGTGFDTLRLGQNFVGEQSAIVDVHLGTLRMGTGSGNTISGFESYVGTSGNDRFIDGVGDQRYNGSFGVDTFVFTGGRAGADVITGREAVDIIQLRGFGPSLNSFAEVLTNTTDTASGAVIQTGAGSSILLSGVFKASFVADDFTF